MNQSLPFKEEHFLNRKIWAQKLLFMGEKWKKVIFRDEKNGIWMDLTILNIIGMNYKRIKEIVQNEYKGVVQ